MIHRIIGGFLGLYHVVEPDEAHVRVLMNRKEVFMSRQIKGGPEHRPSYWTVPFVTKMTKLPLTNIRIDVPDVKLNDSNMAKFVCDIVCFVNITDPILAAERTGITTEQGRYEGQMPGVESLSRDFQAIMESIGRTVSTKQTILDIYKDRSKLDQAVTAEVEKVFPQWGLELVDLEVKDIKDVIGSTIISDIEKKQAAVINADARSKIAEENKRAVLVEAENTQISEVARAVAEETFRKRQIEKDRTIGEQEQLRIQKIAEMEKEAQVKHYAVVEVQTVRQAEINKQQAIILANQRKEAEAINMEQKQLEGQGDRLKQEEQAKGLAAPIYEKLKAEAKGKEELQAALNKFGDGAIRALVAEQLVEMQRAVGIATAGALTQADVKVFSGGGNSGEDGFDLGKMISSMSVSNPASADAVLNKLARPGDLGLTALGLDSLRKGAKDNKKA